MPAKEDEMPFVDWNEPKSPQETLDEMRKELFLLRARDVDPYQEYGDIGDPDDWKSRVAMAADGAGNEAACVALEKEIARLQARIKRRKSREQARR